MFEKLKSAVSKLGKPEWRTMLVYMAGLHERSTHPCLPPRGGTPPGVVPYPEATSGPRQALRIPFKFPWEEIGPGYCYAPAFGHWDIVHAVLDVLPDETEHASHQLMNNLALQQDNGFVPGSLWLREGEFTFSKEQSHPPLWPRAVQAYYDATHNNDLIEYCYGPLLLQIEWFEKNRRADQKGFYYLDILDHRWESGVDESVRFDEIAKGPFACIDATCHVYWLYESAAQWSGLMGQDPQRFENKAQDLRDFIQNELFDEATGYFYDIKMVNKPEQRSFAFEGMWPVVVGAATDAQARRVIEENLLNPDRYFSKHPIASVGLKDPKFELRLWRGPVWNSMTYWAARGCIRYNRSDGAKQLLENALDGCARQFARTGTIWEFYHPHGGKPEDLTRKPHTEYNQPCKDYLGHNPLIAMARLFDSVLDAKND